MGHEVKILDTRKLLSADPERAKAGKMDLVVSYQVDGLRTGFIILPKDRATDLEIQQAITAEEQVTRAGVGKSFTLP
jgi:hypothetical protein